MYRYIDRYVNIYIYIYILSPVFFNRTTRLYAGRSVCNIYIFIVSVSHNVGRCDFIENWDVKILTINLVGFVLNPKSLQVFFGGVES